MWHEAVAGWINRQGLGVAVVAVGPEIFQVASKVNPIVMTKDRDFFNLLEHHGPPSQD
jgi:predicted nuclease of predicted toxin-antitoxin system